MEESLTLEMPQNPNYIRRRTGLVSWVEPMQTNVPQRHWKGLLHPLEDLKTNFPS